MKNIIFENLKQNGFHIFRKIIPRKSVEYGQNCFNGPDVNYSKMRIFKNDMILKNINKKLKRPITSIKYRASNNNNSIDASALHRDDHNHYSKTAIPIYTCLTYLDKAVMELIPTSHNHTVIKFCELMKFYNSRIKIILNPGDVLLINSSILHRGIYYKNLYENRRLIQLFDCLFQDDFARLSKYIFHTEHENDNLILSNLMIFISKIKPLINYINFIYYINTARGYGFNFDVLSKINEKKYRFISLESNKRYIPKYDNSWEKGNVYIMSYATNNITPQQNKIIYFYMNIYTIILLSLSVLFIILIILKLIKLHKKHNKITNKGRINNNLATKRRRNNRNNK
tara:strand:- start:18 stop:1043 length:1026 start_codon:yes stop_codon:yes gene_type:complete